MRVFRSSFIAIFAALVGSAQFIGLKIPPAPPKEDETWSDWIFATQRAELSPVSEPEHGAPLSCPPHQRLTL